MKKIFLLMALAIASLSGMAPAAQAKLTWGVKAGIDVNKIRFDESVISSDNRCGFTAGLMGQYIAPAIGLGADVSLMYVRRDLRAELPNNNATEQIVNHRSYLEIPVNLKYMLTLPVVSKVCRPFITTGPSFAFLMSKREITEAFKNRAVDVSWNFGFGVELIKHVQVAASYGFGLSNSVVSRLSKDNIQPIEIDGKTRAWTLTAAWVF